MKGIVLAGGSGTRLWPLTQAISKQLLPVYDKPTIYYPLSVLMLSGLKEILVISTPRDLPLIRGLLGTGERLGLQLTYKEQATPNGIAQAFILGEEFLAGEAASLVLGDNIFYGHDVPRMAEEAANIKDGAAIFAYHVQDPERYGVVELNQSGRPVAIEEKPKHPKSPWAVTGLYFYDQHVSKYARQMKPSARGELEITDLNRIYLEKGQLKVFCLGRGVAWLDTGTHESLIQSSAFVQAIETRQGLKIACLEEIALRQKLIGREDFLKLADQAPASAYGNYLKLMALQIREGIFV